MRRGPDRPTLVAIATGLVLGAVTLFVAVRLGVLAMALPIVAVAILHRKGVAVSAGLLTAFGVAYFWATVAAANRCAEFNRQPNAGCQSFGVTESLILAAGIAALGALLAMFVLVRQRR